MNRPWPDPPQWPPQTLNRVCESHLHRLSSSDTIADGRFAELRQIFLEIVAFQGRAARDLRLHVGFKEVSCHDDMTRHWDVADCTFQLEADGAVVSTKRGPLIQARKIFAARTQFMTMTTSELETKEQQLNPELSLSPYTQNEEWAVKLLQYWRDIKLELSRRSNNETLTELYGDDSVTLFDLWKN